MTIDNIRNQYILNKTQLILLDESGQIVQSDNHLLKVSLKTAIATIHPFFETIQVLLNQAHEAIIFNCVHLSYKKSEGIFDLIFKTENKQNFIVLYDFTQHYNSFQSIAQDRNHNILNFYYEQLKTEQLFNEKAFKQKFLSQLSTDLKTPIETVMALQDVLYHSNLQSHQKNLALEVKDYLQNIYEKVESIYDLVKIEQGILKNNVVPFYLKKSIRQLEKKYLRLSAKKKNDFEISFQDKLPDYFEGDSLKLLQILEAMLNNSFKFTNEGHVNLSIYEAYKRANQIWLTFEINDSGQGLNNPKIRKNLENNLQLNDEYLGLGFSLIKKLLTPLNATLKYKPNQNQGSSFLLTIPLQVNLFEKPSKEKVFEKMTFEKKINVLCLDDQEINHLVMMKMLIAHGQVYIDTANNYKEALRLLDNSLYDVILLNADMPQFDPQSFYDIVKNKWKRKAPKFICLSQTFEANNKTVFKYVLRRPFVAEELYQKIYQSLKLIN